MEGVLGVDKDTIEMYFESERRAGGDDIDTIELDEEGTAAVITFKSEEGNQVVSLTLSQMSNFRPFQTERVCRRQF